MGVGTDYKYHLHDPGFSLLSLVLLARIILRVHKLMRLWMLLVIFKMPWLKSFSEKMKKEFKMFWIMFTLLDW